MYFGEENYDSEVIQLSAKRISAKWKKILHRRRGEGEPFDATQTTTRLLPDVVGVQHVNKSCKHKESGFFALMTTASTRGEGPGNICNFDVKSNN